MIRDHNNNKLVQANARHMQSTDISLHSLDYTVQRLIQQDRNHTAHIPFHLQFSSDSLYTGHSSSQSHSVYKSTVPFCDRMDLILHPYPVSCMCILGKIKLCQPPVLSLQHLTKTVKLLEFLIIAFVCSDPCQKIILKSKCIIFG